MEQKRCQNKIQGVWAVFAMALRVRSDQGPDHLHISRDLYSTKNLLGLNRHAVRDQRHALLTTLDAPGCACY